MRWSSSSPAVRLCEESAPIVPVNFADTSVKSVAAEFVTQAQAMARCHTVDSSVHAGGLLCGFDGSSSVFSRIEFTSVAAASRLASEPPLSSESVLANCARQQKLIVEDVRSLQRAFWVASREAWELTRGRGSGDAEEKENPPQRQEKATQAHAHADRSCRGNGAAQGGLRPLQWIPGRTEQPQAQVDSITSDETDTAPHRKPTGCSKLPPPPRRSHQRQNSIAVSAFK